MHRALPRALVDTSVWVAALLNPDGYPGRILQALRDGRFVPVVSQLLLHEIEEVPRRPRIRRRIPLTDDEIEEARKLLRDKAVMATVTGQLRLCRDPDDDFALETAIAGRANYLVTRDDDMKRDLDLIHHLRERGVDVLSVARFLELLETDSA